MSGKTTLVTNAVQLVSAAKKAAAGDTILLAPGNYGDVSFSSIKPAGTVTFRSADPDNDAVIRSLRLTYATNLSFEDIDVQHTLRADQSENASAVNVNKSSNISFRGMDIQGSMNGNHFDDGNGLVAANSSGITVLDSTFQQFNNAVLYSKLTDAVFSGNSIRDAREGVHIGTTNGGLFERNFLTNIVGDESKSDHADGFQVQGVFTASNDLTFRSNVIIADDAQGIFIRSEHASKGVFHSNIVIDNNYYEGGMRNGFAVSDATGVTITNNTVREGDGPGLVPAIVVGGVTDAVVSGNIAPLLFSRSDLISTNLTWSDNIDLWDYKTGTGIAIEDVFQAPPVSGAIDFSSLAPTGSANVSVEGIGFRAVDGIGAPGGFDGMADAMLVAHMPQWDLNLGALQLV